MKNVSTYALQSLRSGLMPTLLVAELIIFSLLSDQFWTSQNITDLIVNSGDLAFLAAGMTLVIILGGIDVSLGPMLGIIAWLAAFMQESGYNPPLIVLAALGLGIALGTLNGSIVVFGGVAPIIATLGMSAIYQTTLFILWNSQDRFARPITTWLSGDPIVGIPKLVFPIIIIYFIVFYVLKNRRFGRHIYAVGNDQEGAILLGVSRAKVTLGTYITMGSFTAIGALIYIGRVGVVQANSGAELSIAAIAAVVVGGTSILGGQGGVMRTLGGLLFIAILQKGIVLAGIPSLWTGAVVGLAVALAVSVDVITTKLIDKERGM